MYRERPLLIPLIFLVAGCLLEYLLTVPFSIVIPIFLLLLLVFAASIKCRVLFGGLLALFCAAWSMAALAPRLDDGSLEPGISAFDGQSVRVEGLIVDRPVLLTEGQHLELQVERVFTDRAVFQTDGHLLVTIATGYGGWLTGDRIRCIAKIRVPRLLGLPGEFDYPRYLKLHGIQAIAWVKDADGVVLMRGAANSSLRRKVDALALHSQAFIRQSVSQPDQASVLLALATGQQQEITPTLVAAYSRAGVSHILSVSGFHVGVVTFVWVALLRWLMLRWEWLALRIDVRRASLLAALPVMVLYLLFTGGAPATARSVLMLSAVVLAVWSEREGESLNALIVAAFLLLLYDPGVLFDLSFQLSFLSLWGVITLTPLLIAPFERLLKQGWQRSLALFCAASLAATLSTMVPVLVSFHQASFTGILANLLVVPLLGYGATVLATAAVPVLFWIPSLARLMLQLAGWLVQISNAFVVWIANLPVLRSFRVGTADLMVAIVLLALLSFVKSVRSRWMISTLVSVGLVLFHVLSFPQNDGKLRMTFLSVGQGDATLINLPDGRIMLVDGGGYLRENGKDFGERYLVPALHSLKVGRIDVMVLTHPHPDHLGGLAAVAEQFQVGEFWQGSTAGSEADYQRLLRALNHQRTAIRVLKRGDQPLLAQNLAITVVSPLDSQQAAAGDNDDSLVLHLQQGHFSALLMGDAGFPVEEQLVGLGIGTTTVLKVGHHGSKTASSESFLQRIKPRLAVISAGAGNRFGLPAAEAIARIMHQGTILYRTDQQGTIEVTSDGNSFTATPLVIENRLVVAVRRFILTGSNLLR